MARTDKHRMTREDYKNIVEAQNQRKNGVVTTNPDTNNYNYTSNNSANSKNILISSIFGIGVIAIIIFAVIILSKGMDFLFYTQNAETKLLLYIVTFTCFLVGFVGLIFYTVKLFIRELNTFLKSSVLSYLRLFSITFVGLALGFITLIWLVSLIIMLSSIGKARVYCGIVNSDPEIVRTYNRRRPDTITKRYTIEVDSNFVIKADDIDTSTNIANKGEQLCVKGYKESAIYSQPFKTI